MLELFNSIRLDKESKTALYMQLYEKFKEMIVSGILLPDFRLPSVRQMAALLQVNQVTIVSAYRLLESNGYVYSKPGSGTYVSDIILPENTDGRAAMPRKGHLSSGSTVMQDEVYPMSGKYSEAEAADYSDDYQLSLISGGQIQIHENTIDFASATPTHDLFPVENFKVVLNEVLDRDKGSAFGYQDSQGFPPLRESISGILQNSGVYTSPESIQIISGAQQGIDIISKALLRQGDYVITESPTYTGAIAVFKSRGARIADVEFEPDGPNLNALEYSLKKYSPKLIYTIPSFQNPTGYSYSNRKREEVLRLAEKYNAYIIEDDYVSDLDFEEKKLVPLKVLDRGSRVVFIKSFSKIFMPGLRLGFMLVPSGLQAHVTEAKHTSDISTSGLIQRAFDLYIRNGFWNKHFEFMYEIYKERYFKIINALDSFLPTGVDYYKPGGGLNVWLNLPYGLLAGSLFKQASSNGIVFAPGRIFYSGSSPQKLNSIRLSFAAAHTGQIETGIETLCRIIKSMRQKQDYFKNLPIL